MCEHQDLEESRRREVQQTVRDMEEEWRRVLQTAEETLRQAQVWYSLSRQLEAFQALEESSRAWFQLQQQNTHSLGAGTRGSKEEIQDRLQRATVRATLHRRIFVLSQLIG